jgi:hypothetical protein
MQAAATGGMRLATAVHFSMLAVRVRQGAATPGVHVAAAGSRRGPNIG